MHILLQINFNYYSTSHQYNFTVLSFFNNFPISRKIHRRIKCHGVDVSFVEGRKQARLHTLGNKGDLFKAESENTSGKCEGVLAHQKIGDRYAWWMEIALHIFPPRTSPTSFSRALLVLQCWGRWKHKAEICRYSQFVSD